MAQQNISASVQQQKMMLIREHQQFIAMPQQPSPPQQIMQQQGVHHNQQQAMPMHRQPLMQPVQLQQQWQSTSPHSQSMMPHDQQVMTTTTTTMKTRLFTRGGRSRRGGDQPQHAPHCRSNNVPMAPLLNNNSPVPAPVNVMIGANSAPVMPDGISPTLSPTTSFDGGDVIRLQM
jgi:hypothetical protein